QKALQVKLWRDAQIKIEIERVVMGDEGLGRRAARNRLEHRRFDFEETARGQEAADRGDDAAAVAQRRAAILAHYQIEIALAIARLEIGEAVIFLRQRQQRLGQQRDLGGIDRQFA